MLAFVLVFGCSLGHASNGQLAPAPEIEVMDVLILDQSDLELPDEAAGECTFTIRTELDDGTRIESEVTVSDLSWWDCTKTKIGVWWTNDF